jgi:hypothetical protein
MTVNYNRKESQKWSQNDQKMPFLAIATNQTIASCDEFRLHRYRSDPNTKSRELWLFDRLYSYERLRRIFSIVHDLNQFSFSYSRHAENWRQYDWCLREPSIVDSFLNLLRRYRDRLHVQNLNCGIFIFFWFFTTTTTHLFLIIGRRDDIWI